MFIKIFKSNNPFLIIILFILGLLLWANGFMHYKHINTEDYYSIVPLYNIVINFIRYPFFKVLLAFVIILIQTLILNSIVSNSNIGIKNTYLPGLLYIVLVSYNPQALTLHPIIFVNLFLIIILNNIFKIYDKNEAFREIYNIGLLISLSSLFYFPSVLFIIVLWISFIIYRLFGWREWSISIIGLITPYIFIIIYLFLTDNMEYIYSKYNGFIYTLEIVNLKGNTYLLCFLIYLAILSFMAVSSTLLRINEKVIQERKYLAIVVWVLIVFLLFTFFSGKQMVYTIEILFIPLSVFISNYFLKMKRKVTSEIAFFILLIIIIAGKFL